MRWSFNPWILLLFSVLIVVARDWGEPFETATLHLFITHMTAMITACMWKYLTTWPNEVKE